MLKKIQQQDWKPLKLKPRNWETLKTLLDPETQMLLANYMVPKGKQVYTLLKVQNFSLKWTWKFFV